MSDQDYLPEEDYDPASGEYNSAFDFTPPETHRVFLNAEHTVWADVSGVAGFEFDIEAAKNQLEDVAGSGIFDPDFNQRNPEDYPDVPADFDYTDKTTRGPFFTDEAVENFLTKSGLRGTAKVYYDEANDEFWIDVDTN